MPTSIPTTAPGPEADTGTEPAGCRHSACQLRFVSKPNQEIVMLYWAAVFLVIGLVAMLLGAGGVAGLSMNIAWILFVVGIVMAIVFFVLGRRPKL